MGPLKVLFRSFCLNRRKQSDNDCTFNQNTDVSHLATPHISSNVSLAVGSSTDSIPVCGNINGDSYNYYNQHGQAPNVNGCSAPNSYQRPSEPPDRRESSEENNNNRPQPSPPSPASSPLNLYSSPQPSQDIQHQQAQQQLHRPINGQALPQQQVYDPQDQGSNEPTTKLSYDIISVREPLAKILAERQQLQQAQQQQRQILGDHEYIEVYGDRGSSCFYEEIAGSTTSSATYDQIDAPLNHNYQVLINAYAIVNRPNGSFQSQSANGDRLDQNLSSHNINGNNTGQNKDENMYDVTHTSTLGNSSSNILEPKPSTSFSQNNDPSTSQYQSDRLSGLSQSIPVYSVINKATRRNNAIIRATVDSCRPPQPPPKNLSMTHQPSTSAIPNSNHESAPAANARNSPQISTISFYDASYHTRLPQPPPRLSKRPMFNASNRPLPLPCSFDNEGLDNDHLPAHDDDIESVNNGYELLGSNFDDDQIDVGYEKIRESRYSGGSISSQFRQLQGLDNDGYESVQPIYYSPSNALAEPNYEAIGPATASELAAAATARLTAAVAMEQFLKKD